MALGTGPYTGTLTGPSVVEQNLVWHTGSLRQRFPPDGGPKISAHADLAEILPKGSRYLIIKELGLIGRPYLSWLLGPKSLNKKVPGPCA